MKTAPGAITNMRLLLSAGGFHLIAEDFADELYLEHYVGLLDEIKDTKGIKLWITPSTGKPLNLIDYRKNNIKESEFIKEIEFIVEPLF